MKSVVAAVTILIVMIGANSDIESTINTEGKFEWTREEKNEKTKNISFAGSVNYPLVDDNMLTTDITLEKFTVSLLEEIDTYRRYTEKVLHQFETRDESSPNLFNFTGENFLICKFV